MKLLLLLPLLVLSACSVYFEPEFNYTDEQFRISQVVDGDTLIISNGDYVRLIGIDAPEKGKEGYHEATDFLRKFEGRNVTLESEGADRDRYGRLLRHAFVGNTSLAVELLRSNHSELYTDYNGTYYGEFVDALG